MFLTGFSFGSAIVYLICLQEYLMPPYGNVVVALCAGLLFGLITMLIQYVGLFMTGFHTGVLLAIAGLAIYDHFLDARPSTYWLCVVVLLCSGIFFAVINLYWKKVLTIFGTSVYGGAVIATSLDYFFERMMMLKWVITTHRFIITISVIRRSLMNVGHVKASLHRLVTFLQLAVFCELHEIITPPSGSPTNAAPSVVGARETGAGSSTTLPTVMADPGSVASCSYSRPDRSVRPNGHWDLPRAEYKRTKASFESPTDSTDHTRATYRDETTQVQVPVPGPYCPWGCHLSVVRTSAAEKSPMRELERRVQHSPERLDPPYCTRRIRGRPTYRQRR